MRRTIFTLRSLLLLCLLTFVGGAYAQDNVLFNETFDACAGTGGNDGTWAGITGNKTADVDGWTFVKGNAASGCVQIGVSKTTGSATTPAINLNGNATLTFRAGAWNNDGTTLTISMEGGKLETEQVTMESGAFTEYTIHITEGTTGAKITFTGGKASKNRFFLDDVKVVGEGGTVTPSKKDPELSFPQAEYTVNYGEAFTEPVLNNPHNLPVTYSSNYEKAITVDAQTGKLTFLKGGYADITATFAGNDEYEAGTATYKITVTDLNAIAYYRKATAITSGVHYLIAAQNDDKLEVMNTVYLSEGKHTGFAYLKATEIDAADAVRLDNGDHDFVLNKNADGNYTLFQSKGGLTFYQENNDKYKTFSFTDQPESVEDQSTLSWTAEAQEDGTFSLKNAGSNKSIQYSTDYSSYGAYADVQGIFPYLYERYQTIPAITTAEGYATYFSTNGFIMPEGLKGTTISYDAANDKLVMNWEYEAGSYVPAGTALLIKGEQGKSYEALVADTDEQAAENVLAGAATATTPEGNGKFYMLSYDKDGKNLGFYFANADGSAFESAAGKAYLHLDATTNTKGFSLNDGTATGIQSATIAGQTAAPAVYTLSGIRVNTTANLPQGVYIIGGKKVIIK